MNFYIDSSALVKFYIDEVGSERIRAIALSEESNIFISKITGVEIAAAFARRMRMKDMAEGDYKEALSDFLTDLDGLFVKSEVTDAVVSLAIELAERQMLRGYDAVQLATALTLRTEIKDEVIFISTDRDLNNAARIEGLTVEDLGSK